MQRSRRRKLLREGKRDPMMLRAIRDRDVLRSIAYQGVSREQRRSGLARVIEPRARNLLREAYGQMKAALR